MAAYEKADIEVQPGYFGFRPEADIQELREDFSARTPNSAKCNGVREIDTRVNGCPALLDFRKRGVYSTILGHYTWMWNPLAGGLLPEKTRFK